MRMTCTGNNECGKNRAELGLVLKLGDFATVADMSYKKKKSQRGF